MRIQYAVICHDFQDGEWEGVTNLGGVRHKLFAPMQLDPAADPDGPKPPVPIKLVVSLIDGEPGWHNVPVDPVTNVRRVRNGLRPERDGR